MAMHLKRGNGPASAVRLNPWEASPGLVRLRRPKVVSSLPPCPAVKSIKLQPPPSPPLAQTR